MNGAGSGESIVHWDGKAHFGSEAGSGQVKEVSPPWPMTEAPSGRYNTRLSRHGFLFDGSGNVSGVRGKRREEVGSGS